MGGVGWEEEEEQRGEFWLRGSVARSGGRREKNVEREERRLRRGRERAGLAAACFSMGGPLCLSCSSFLVLSCSVLVLSSVSIHGRGSSTRSPLLPQREGLGRSREREKKGTRVEALLFHFASPIDRGGRRRKTRFFCSFFFLPHQKQDFGVFVVEAERVEDRVDPVGE